MWDVVAMASTMELLKFISYLWSVPNLYSNNEIKSKSMCLVHNVNRYLSIYHPYFIATQMKAKHWSNHLDLNIAQ